MINEILIDKIKLLNNIKQVRLENPNSLLCAMVKANAYGVGMKEVVKIIDAFVDYYGVACFFEAKKLKCFTKKKILILGCPHNIKNDPQLSFSCNSLDDVKFLIRRNEEINVHIKINTGMNRYGFHSLKEFRQALKLIKNSKLHFEGLYTHFATADDYVKSQVYRFLPFVFLAKKMGFDPLIHADNSAVNLTHNHHLDMIRIGFNLYNKSGEGFCPVVRIKSKIEQINFVKRGELVGYDYHFVAPKDMLVAVVPFGYADGFDMSFIGMEIYIKDMKCKILNICMDCFLLDVSDVKTKKGDDIYILNNINSLKMYADYINTSEYEIMTKFSYSRAKRKIINND